MFVLRKLKAFVSDPVESIFLQVPRALAVSVLALALDFGIYALGLQVGLPALLAAIIGYLGGGMWDPLESTCRHASLSIL